MNRTLIAAILLTIAGSASAHPALDAIAAADKKKLQELHHRAVETSVNNGVSTKTISSYNPSASADQRWTLESINGRAPSETELADFHKKKKKPANTKISELLDPASLKPLDKAGQTRRWGFRFKEGKQINGLDMNKFGGVVTLGEAGQATSIDLTLEESVRLKVIYKISRMNIQTNYAQLPNGDVIVRSSGLQLEAGTAVHSVSQNSQTSYELIKNGSGS